MNSDCSAWKAAPIKLATAGTYSLSHFLALQLSNIQL